MTDRWARAEERFRQREADRRYRRNDQAWEQYEDDTNVIPRYTDDDQDESLAAGRSRRAAPQRAEHADAAPRRGRGPNAQRGESAQRGEGSQPRRSRGDGLGGGRSGAGAGAARTGRPGRNRPERGEGSAEERSESRSERQRGGSSRGRRSRMASRKAAERKKRRRHLWLIGAMFVLLFIGAAAFAGMKIAKMFGAPEDYAGPVGPLVVVQVQPGDTSNQIADAMQQKGIVASSEAFFQAAVRNSNMNSVQPGYYAIPSHSPAAQAVTALLSKESRVGNLVVSEGRQLHDQQDVNTGSRKDGIYRKIADASCVGTGTNKKCVTYDQLDAAGAGMDLPALGVPSWAEQRVRDVPDRSRQLEGLIAAGTWDFDPSGTPEQILKQVVSASARSYESTGLLQSGTETKLNPYQTLIAASLVEREALPQDMGKVARVIVNRLDVNQPLQFDSTVNYALDRTEVATTDTDRAKRTPWNTYAMPGLPATPISAPSLNALRAMENPEAGTWLYFVTVDKQGTTLFTESYSEHLRNIEKARQSGILDSGR
ncbi:endolytic transglycosylase MltG [Nocardia sp. NBC_00565]|uniref:endolytic transglycosylase MltG n=1 Tax=Nocardia sp. NBC_00565 TaxID=2975993 RepID=UPI002E81B6CA|nr:endolytic transglycosylase MltG [Nocardia sp. NBC_00565]WUC07159.1 endolytic transglycosylase MltG [Nocardia sp. NBC_00565]